ncbi:MAG: SDR family oxidoreductase [Acholeplasmatales bacterium]|nr:SDR family oxidoreductase [Acholeplasmatales bacterium]
MEYALITGASSGIGREFARQLHNLGYGLIVCARRVERLEELKNELKDNVIIYPLDLVDATKVIKMVNDLREYNITLVINNAGFGDFGKFSETDMSKELRMIDTNVTGLYLLTKLYIKEFIKNNKGYILNVASIAGILPGGGYMAQYYATKAYVKSLTLGIYRELKEAKSNVHISALCPGPVNTEFNDVANVDFGLKGISAEACVKYCLKKMKKHKTIIIPGASVRMAARASKLCSDKFLVRITSNQQKKKLG